MNSDRPTVDVTPMHQSGMWIVRPLCGFESEPAVRPPLGLSAVAGRGGRPGLGRSRPACRVEMGTSHQNAREVPVTSQRAGQRLAAADIIG